MLSFYGLVEVASCIDFLPATLPQSFRQQALEVLSNPAVRRYYEWNYPLPIVNRFRERLLGWFIQQDRSGAAGKISLFYRFLSLLDRIESDDRVTTFLWLLDSGEEGGHDIDDLLHVLSNAELFLSSTARRRQRRIDKAVIGFSRFLDICVEYDALLRDTIQVPILAESIWLHQAYWFYRLHEDFGEDLERSINVTTRWTKSKADKRKMAARNKQLLGVMTRLKQPPSGTNITEAHERGRTRRARKKIRPKV